MAALTATSPRRAGVSRRRAAACRDEPDRDRDSEPDGRPLVADVSMGRVTHGDVLAGRSGPEEARPVRRRPGPQGVRARGRPGDAGRRARRREHGALLLVAKPGTIPCPGFARLPKEPGYPVIAETRGSSRTGSKSLSFAAISATCSALELVGPLELGDPALVVAAVADLEAGGVVVALPLVRALLDRAVDHLRRLGLALLSVGERGEDVLPATARRRRPASRRRRRTAVSSSAAIAPRFVRGARRRDCPPARRSRRRRG